MCKKHLYKGFSKSSCFVNLSEIKNTLLKHQICWKISAKSAGLKRETYFTNSYIFLNFFYNRNTNFQEHREFFLFIFFFSEMCQAIIYSLCFFVSSKNLVSYKLGTLQHIFLKFYLYWKESMMASFILQYCKNIALFKFGLNVNKRNSYTYCFIRFESLPTWDLLICEIKPRT